MRKYFAAAVKPPAKGSYEGFEMGRAAAALEKVIKGDTETLEDVQALEVLNVSRGFCERGVKGPGYQGLRHCRIFRRSQYVMSIVGRWYADQCLLLATAWLLLACVVVCASRQAKQAIGAVMNDHCLLHHRHHLDVQVMLPELWRWRRRGKGGWDDSNETIHRCVTVSSSVYAYDHR